MLFSRSPTAAAILYDAQQHQQSHHHDVATAAAAAVVKRTLFTGSYARDGTIFMSFAIAITVLRTYSRWKMVGFQGFRADDFLVWLALALYIADTITDNKIVTKYHGLTNDGMSVEARATLSPDSEEYRLRVGGSILHLAAWPMYVLLLWSLKAAMAVFYLRLMDHLHAYRRKIYIGFVLIGVTFLTAILVPFLCCVPTRKMWQINPDPGNLCYPESSPAILWTILSCNIVTDAYLLWLPMPMLFQSTLPKVTKIVLMLLFGCGIFVTAAAAMTILVVVTRVEGDFHTIGFWAARETFVAILTTNLPAIFVVLRSWLKPSLAFLRSGSTGARPSQGEGGGSCHRRRHRHHRAGCVGNGYNGIIYYGSDDVGATGGSGSSRPHNSNNKKKKSNGDSELLLLSGQPPGGGGGGSSSRAVSLVRASQPAPAPAPPKSRPLIISSLADGDSQGSHSGGGSSSSNRCSKITIITSASSRRTTGGGVATPPAQQEQEQQQQQSTPPPLPDFPRPCFKKAFFLGFHGGNYTTTDGGQTKPQKQKQKQQQYQEEKKKNKKQQHQQQQRQQQPITETFSMRKLGTNSNSNINNNNTYSMCCTPNTTTTTGGEKSASQEQFLTFNNDEQQQQQRQRGHSGGSLARGKDAFSPPDSSSDSDSDRGGGGADDDNEVIEDETLPISSLRTSPILPKSSDNTGLGLGTKVASISHKVSKFKRSPARGAGGGGGSGINNNKNGSSTAAASSNTTILGLGGRSTHFTDNNTSKRNLGTSQNSTGGIQKHVEISVQEEPSTTWDLNHSPVEAYTVTRAYNEPAEPESPTQHHYHHYLYKLGKS